MHNCEFYLRDKDLFMGLEPIISFQNVDKRFAFTKEKPQSVMETFIKLFSRRKGPKPPPESLWAVRGVSFDVLPGQCFGIVGRNGSGKSTILKLMARILRPNNGRILINGRVSALLELGAGFHPRSHRAGKHLPQRRLAGL